MMEFSVHSTFRGMYGEQALPNGLEWNVAGESFVAYVPWPTAPKHNIDKEEDSNEKRIFIYPTGPTIQDTPAIRQAILEAHNRWCFAKDLCFRSVDEMEQLLLPNIDTGGSIQSSELVHYYVKWRKHPMSPNLIFSRLQQATDVIQTDPSAVGDQPSAQVWINGMYHQQYRTLLTRFDKLLVVSCQ
jgi:hypothetical protein